jgi:hypothetical protein
MEFRLKAERSEYLEERHNGEPIPAPGGVHWGGIIAHRILADSNADSSHRTANMVAAVTVE